GRRNDPGHFPLRAAGDRSGRPRAWLPPRDRGAASFLGPPSARRNPARPRGLRPFEAPGPNMILTIAILVFAFILVLVIGVWWVSQADRTVRERLKQPGPRTGAPDILRP